MNSGFFKIKKSGIDWFDEIIEKDEIIIDRCKWVDIIAIDKRLNELIKIHNISSSKPFFSPKIKCDTITPQ